MWSSKAEAHIKKKKKKAEATDRLSNNTDEFQVLKKYHDTCKEQKHHEE